MNASHHKGKITALAFTPDTRYAVSASEDRTLKIWDVNTGKMLGTLAGHGDTITDVAVTPNGSRLVSSSRDGTVKIWDLRTGANLETLEHNGWVTCLAVTPDGERVVSISAESAIEGRVMTWELRNGRLSNSFLIKDNFTTAIAITPDGRKALITSVLVRLLSVYDLKNGELISWLSDETVGRKMAVDVSPDGHFAVSCDDRGEVTYWDIDKAEYVFRLQHYVRDYNEPNHWQNPGLFMPDVGFLDNGQSIMSCSRGGTIKIWDVASQKLKYRLFIEKELTACAITPDGMNVAAGDESGYVYFFTQKDFILEK